MKKKTLPPAPPLVPEKLLEEMRNVLAEGKVARPAKCVVCAGECAPNSTEGLCWVCRRLKISAWRDSDSQMNAQE